MEKTETICPRCHGTGQEDDHVMNIAVFNAPVGLLTMTCSRCRGARRIKS